MLLDVSSTSWWEYEVFGDARWLLRGCVVGSAERCPRFIVYSYNYKFVIHAKRVVYEDFEESWIPMKPKSARLETKRKRKLEKDDKPLRPIRHRASCIVEP